MEKHINETESIPFSIKESMFSSSEEVREVKARLGLKSVNEALSYADRNGWLYTNVRISAICPNCGFFVRYEKNGTRYDGRCNNCCKEFHETFPTADMFLECIYGEFHRKAKDGDQLTHDGKTSPCVMCGSSRVMLYSNGEGKWSCRCSKCGNSLCYYAPRPEYAVAVWNQLALDSIRISVCPTCGVDFHVYTETSPCGTFRCRCSKCGMVGIEGATKSEAWRLWNQCVGPRDKACDGKQDVDSGIMNEDKVLREDRVSALEAENAYLKDLLARFIGIALGVRDANAPLVASLENIHKASSALSASLRSIPFEEMKNPPDGLKDFMTKALEGRENT